MIAHLRQHRAHITLAALAVGLFTAVAIMILCGDKRSAAPCYSFAANRWLAGENMYSDSGHGFLYLPHAAILYIPFATAPEPMGEILWRAVSLAAFVVGVYRCCRLFPGNTPLFNLSAGFVALLVCGNSFRIGQATLLMTACMLWGIDSLARSRWTRATAFLVLAFAVKPLAIVLVLLAGAIYRPMLWRLAVACLLVLPIVPFAAQSPDYVIWQYERCASMLYHAHELGNHDWQANVFGLLKTWGCGIAPELQTLIRTIAAVVTLAICWLAHRRLDGRRSLVWLYTFAAIYLTLFNPRAENNTYCILGPAVALFYAEAIVQRRFAIAGMLLMSAVAMLGSYEIGKYFTPENARHMWLAPLAASVFTVYVLIRLRGELKASEHLDAPAHVQSAAA